MLGTEPDRCPCGAGDLASCCGPYLRRAAHPATAEALMRSRYTAFVLGDTDHLWRTWHPATRPDEVTVDERLRWTGLEVTATVDGGSEDDAGEVAFVARFEADGEPGELVEHSRFRRRGGRWFYVDGDVRG